MLLTAAQSQDLLERHQMGPPSTLLAWFRVSGEDPSIQAGLGRAALPVRPLEGFPPAEANRLAALAGLVLPSRAAASDLLVDLWEVMVEEDLLEVRYGPGLASVTVDDAAAFRHPDWSRFGFGVDPRGGPYLARADVIAAIDAGGPLPPGGWGGLPVLDSLMVRAYAEAHGSGQ
ncbi:MAG: hypothetical protein LBJ02_11915 [Bifidobacteriaceae bacterium]|nr:hypothetical protein [Bifidobacteriaceae bacterium]